MNSQDFNKINPILINWLVKKLLWKESCATLSTVWLWLWCTSHTFKGGIFFFVWEIFSDVYFSA
jgi:hypothetical protein